MAKTKLLFCGTDVSKTENHSLQAYSNDKNEIYIEIENDGEYSFICLDRSTSIKLVSELRRQIGNLKAK